MAKTPEKNLSVKDSDAAKNALIRLAKHDYKNATDAQKQKAALDIVKLGKLLGAAWDIIVAVLKALDLPVPVPTK